MYVPDKNMYVPGGGGRVGEWQLVKIQTHKSHRTLMTYRAKGGAYCARTCCAA